ncbi:MAG TPA: 30S ribosome-binding factor RbfA [Gemmatimonadaceae bacterium]|nr:30S ribosome-binding factor RbfA [Gemmatimonadaceae bacterium]
MGTCSSAIERSRSLVPSLQRRARLRNTRRADRVAEAVRVEVATFLTESAKDPRIVGFVTVTGAEVTPDLRHARVYVSVLGSDSEKQATFDGLDSIASHLRSHLARELRLRVAPEIQFKEDDTIARAARIESLLADVKRQEDAAARGRKED